MKNNSRISIFFDLETTDLLRVGQILNFCFLVIDCNWAIVDELTGTVKISPCQLPRASAIVANRTLVSEHQRTSVLSEREALRSINGFIRKYTDSSPRLPMIGYNSDNFDTHYLRSSFLRNGIIPYLPVENKDLLAASRGLLLTNEVFRNLVLEQATPNLKLETLCKAHGLLDGNQLHESRADVVLTIRLAETFARKYGVDIRSFEPYQIKSHHGSNTPIVIQRTTPRISKDSYKSERTMIHLLTAEKAALWIDLEEFEKKLNSENAKEAIKYLRFSDPCIAAPLQNEPDKFAVLGRQAKEQFASIGMNDLFEPKTCYIEQWIYRIRFSEMDNLVRSLGNPQLNNDLSEDLKSLHLRYQIEELPTDHQSFSDYCQYRYGGKMVVDEKNTSKGKQTTTHPTLDELYKEIEELHSKAIDTDRILLEDLKQFYEASPVSQIFRTTPSQTPKS